MDDGMIYILKLRGMVAKGHKKRFLISCETIYSMGLSEYGIVRVDTVVIARCLSC